MADKSPTMGQARIAQKKQEERRDKGRNQLPRKQPSSNLSLLYLSTQGNVVVVSVVVVPVVVVRGSGDKCVEACVVNRQGRSEFLFFNLGEPMTYTHPSSDLQPLFFATLKYQPFF